MCVCAKSLQSCLTLCNPMDCSPQGSSIHGVLQMRILKWVGMPFLGGSSSPRDWTYVYLVSCTGRQVITSVTWEAQCRTSWYNKIFSSVQFSCSVVSDSLRPPELQHTWPPCPSPTPGVHSNSCPLSQWCHPVISFSVIPFSSWLQSFPGSRSFATCQFFTSGGQSIGVSASVSVFQMNIQDWSPLGWTGWISLPSKGLLRFFSNTTVQKHQFFGTENSLESNSHIHTWLLEKP